MEYIYVPILLILSFIIGYQANLLHGKKEKKETTIEMSEADKEKQKKIRDSFEELMSYDYDTALKRGDE